MAKLTRYSSFEELKSAPVENPLTPEESAKAHAEFEALMRRLQQAFAAQKSNEAVDLYTTGRQPSEQDFARISEWIKKNKQKHSTGRNSLNFR